MVVCHNGCAVRRRWFFLLTLLAFGLALGAGGILWYTVEASSVVTVQTRIESLKLVLTAIRLLLITWWPSRGRGSQTACIAWDTSMRRRQRVCLPCAGASLPG